MLDNETLGTTARSVIMSVGLVKFDPATGIIEPGIEVFPSVEEQVKAGRTISDSTVRWWLDQSSEARSSISKSYPISCKEAISKINYYASETNFLWSNGADFDIPALISLMEDFGMEPSWSFRAHRCYRTYAHCKGFSKKEPAHSALEDAIIQTKAIIGHLKEDEYFRYRFK